MAVTRGTLQIARGLRRDIGAEVDDAVRTLTADWVREWDRLASAWQSAADELVAAAVALGRWPYPVEILRMGEVDRAMRGSIAALDKLAERTNTVATDGADRIVRLDAEREPRIIASQAPATEEPALAQRAAGVAAVEALREAWALREDARADVQLVATSRIRTDAVNVMAARAGQQIHSSVLPLAPQAVDAMRRELVAGIDVGANPRTAAARMVASVQGQFNGGLGRATVIARTEMLDAYRATSQQIHLANQDVVPGWQWLSTFDTRVCPSCLAMHGQRFPASEPGPIDHQQGRCARLPVLASWAELGISAPEPPSVMPDAQAWFAGLPNASQLRIMGPGRLRMLDDGLIGWGDLSTLRHTPGWRPSRIPTPLRDLRQRTVRGLPPTPATPSLSPATAARPAAPLRTVPSAQQQLEDLVAGIPANAPRTRLAGGQSATVELVETPGGKVVHKRASDWGDTSPEVRQSIIDQADAEYLAARVGQAIDAPVAAVVKGGPDNVWVEWIPDASPAENWVDSVVGQRVGLLDVLTANPDRNAGNILRSGQRTVAIDHGFNWQLAVQEGNPLRPGTRPGSAPSVRHFVSVDGSRYVDNPLSVRDVDVLRQQLEALRPEFVALGRGDWLDYSLAVLEQLRRHAVGGGLYG